MSTLILMVELLIILGCIVNLIKLAYVFFCIQKVKKTAFDERNTEKTFLIIIPVYHEQTRVQFCIDSIEKINWPGDKLRVVFCTTEKEPITDDDTESVLNNIFERGGLKFTYEVIRYPRTDGNMAEQVNHAYKEASTDYDVVCVYNADSIIMPDVMREVSNKFDDNTVNCIQQRAIYNNYRGKNVFSVGYCFFQSIFELKTNILNDFKDKGENLCGRSLFFRKGFMKDYIYPVEFYCEDMALSFELVCRDDKISGITQFEYNEPPVCLKDIINQQYVWFHTASRIKMMLEYARKGNPSKALNPRAKKKLANRIINNILWYGTTPVMILLCIVSPWFILASYLYCLASVVMTDCMFGIRKLKSVVFDALCLEIYFFILSIGPIKYSLKMLGAKLGINVNDVKYKTPREKEEEEYVK